MTFNTFQFALFFGVVWFLVAVVLRPHRVRALLPRVSRWAVVETRNVVLLVASYVFYGAWDWRFLGLLMGSTTADFLLARAISREGDARRRRVWITISIIGARRDAASDSAAPALAARLLARFPRAGPGARPDLRSRLRIVRLDRRGWR